MAIIKARNSASLLKEAIVLDLGDLRRQADALREQAQAEAAQILADARRQADELIASAAAQGKAQGMAEGRELGYAEGFEQGRTQAIAEHKAAFDVMTANWTKAATEFHEQHVAIRRDARQLILQVATTLAEKLIHRTIEIDEQTVTRQADAALAHVLNPTDVVLRCHPEDRVTLEAAVPTLLESFVHLDHLDLVDDAAVDRGGCVVTYGQGRIDATLETQLRRMAEVMLPDPSHAGNNTSNREPETDAGLPDDHSATGDLPPLEES